MQERTHERLKRAALSRHRVKAEYEALEGEFTLLRELVKARQHAGFSQAQVAKNMGATTSVVGQLETAVGKSKHSPTLATLLRYAKALNCDLKIKLVSYISH